MIGVLTLGIAALSPIYEVCRLTTLGVVCVGDFLDGRHRSVLPARVFAQALAAPVGDVFEEDQAEDDVLAVGRFHVAAQFVGGFEQLGCEAEVGAGIVVFWLGGFGHLEFPLFSGMVAS